VLHAHQPIGAALGTGGLDEQIVDVAFPIGDVGQARIGELLGQGVDAREAVDPTHTLFLFKRAVGVFLLAQAAGLAHPGVGLEQPQRNTLRGERQGRMQIQTPTALVVQWPEPDDAVFLGGVVQLGGVLDAQHPGVRPQTLLGAGDVRGEHRLGADRGMIEQAVGGARLAPAPAGGGNAQRRFLPQLLCEALRAAIEASITQRDRGQLRGQRAHDATPSAARKSAASG